MAGVSRSEPVSVLPSRSAIGHNSRIRQRAMSPNKQIIERYMDGFRRSDHAQVLSCLADDVEWLIPGGFHTHGKDAFDQHIQDEAFVGSPSITVTRMTEEGDVVVAEGKVRTQRTDGTILHLVFCDVFEMANGQIRRLVSYLMPTGGSA
jgi:uncharacterized protein